jgi:hypothetical protein
MRRSGSTRFPYQKSDRRNGFLTPVTVEWMQALDLYGPVQRLEVLIKRRKGERLISTPAASARLTFVPNTLGIASSDDAQPDCSGPRCSLRAMARAGFTRFHRSLDRTFTKFNCN